VVLQELDKCNLEIGIWCDSRADGMHMRVNSTEVGVGRQKRARVKRSTMENKKRKKGGVRHHGTERTERKKARAEGTTQNSGTQLGVFFKGPLSQATRLPARKILRVRMIKI